MEKKLIVSPSPHIHGAMTTRRLMKDVVIALIPALIVATIVYGTSALIVTGVSVAACVAFEYLIQRFMLKGPVTIGDDLGRRDGPVARIQPAQLASYLDRADRRFR